MSEATREACAREAAARGDLYRFRGAGGVLHWIRGQNAHLAPNGAMSLLRRVAIKADFVSEGELTAGAIDDYRALVVPEASHLIAATRDALASWAALPDRRLVVSGRTSLDGAILGVRRLGGIVPETFVASDLGEGDPVSCPGWEIEQVEATGAGKVVGVLAELALPGLVATERTLYLAFPLFGYVGAALQAHVGIETITGAMGQKGIFYLDRLAGWLANLLETYVPSVAWSTRLHPWGRHPSALALRHDTDHSRDSSYLDYEVAHQLPATYAVLPDTNRAWWLERLAPHPFIEASFHYRTNRQGLWFRLRHRAGYEPDPRAITGRGLVRQVRAAARAGIPVTTAHRHAPFFYYPESVDALDAVHRAFPGTVGTGSMFRGTVLSYHRAGDGETRTVRHPHTSVPFWFPFKLVVTTRDESRALRGWESTHALEPDPPLLDELFRHADALPGGAYTLGYHPAHARRPTFTPGGNFDWFVQCVDEAKRRDWRMTTCAGLYRQATEWEALRFRADDGRASVGNPTDQVVRDVVLRTPAGDRPLGDLGPGEEKQISW